MQEFLVNHFFNLQSFTHRVLWKEKDFVWEALHRLRSYLEEMPCFEKYISIPPSVFLDNPDQISLGEGVVLEPSVYIQGPCIIGKGSILRHGAYVRSGCILGENCVIGHGSEVKASILLNGAQIAHLNYVGDSILGAQVNLGAGVKCANLRLDRKEVILRLDGKKIHTRLKKFGCILGDGCKIGCNSVLSPGTILGSGCISYPLVHVQGFIAPRTKIRSKQDALELSSLDVELLGRLR